VYLTEVCCVASASNTCLRPVAFPCHFSWAPQLPSSFLYYFALDRKSNNVDLIRRSYHAAKNVIPHAPFKTVHLTLFAWQKHVYLAAGLAQQASDICRKLHRHNSKAPERTTTGMTNTGCVSYVEIDQMPLQIGSAQRVNDTLSPMRSLSLSHTPLLSLLAHAHVWWWLSLYYLSKLEDALSRMRSLSLTHSLSQAPLAQTHV